MNTTNTNFIRWASISSVAALTITTASHGAFQFFGNKTAWQQAAGSFTIIDFVQPSPMLITNQYASLGVVFPEGNDFVGQSIAFESGDEWGLFSGPGGPGTGSTITMQFTQPINSIAFELPGSFFYKVFSGEQQVLVDIAIGSFRGITSDVPFDRIECYNGVMIDNLYFGPPIPAPGALAFLAVAGFLRARRRR